MLILCGTIAALLLARSLAAATEVSAAAQALQIQMRLDAAVETVAADLLINGPRSAFSMVPAQRDVEIGGRPIHVQIEAESGKIDVNQADLALIDRVAASLGFAPDARALLVEHLRERRTRQAPLRSISELRALVEGAPTNVCLETWFTVHSGRSEPDARFMTPAVASLLGTAQPPDPSSAMTGGAALALRVADGGSARVAIVRMTGRLDQPVALTAWDIGADCS